MNLSRKKKPYVARIALLVAVTLLSRNERTIAEISENESATLLNNNELADMSLDELMKIDVTSVAGVKQSFFHSPAAITVIKPEDISGSGHQSLAELLRLAPGVHVGRESSNIWSISTRGFNGRFANKQLVLIDGRVIYDQFFGGVVWDIQQPMLADVSQIEVIRGPGTTLWGGNAVNGVINVSTYHSRDTQGVLIDQSVGIGDMLDRTNLRYGGKLGEDAFYRVYGQFKEYDNTDFITGGSSQDNWNLLKGGFRADFGKPGELNFTVQGDIYQSDRIGMSNLIPSLNPAVVQTGFSDSEANGGNLLARLSKETGESGWSLQFVFDRIERAENGLSTHISIFDLDFRNHFKSSSRNEIVWGLAIKHSMDDTSHGDSAAYYFSPDSFNGTTYSGFISSTYAIVPDRFYAMVGSKFEHNDYSGFEFQPSARLWYTPNDDHMFWTAISRSVRVPTRADVGTVFNTPAPFPDVALTPDTLDSEIALTYELGYRTRAVKNVTIDLSSYLSDYTRLHTRPIINSPILPMTTNDGEGYIYGAEAEINWQVLTNLKLSGSYSFAHADMQEGLSYNQSASIPQNMFHIASNWDVTKQLQIDTHLYYTDDWENQYAVTPEYFRLDLGLRYKINHSTEIAIWGQNLLDDRHSEVQRMAEDVYGGISEVGRSAFVQVTCRF